MNLPMELNVVGILALAAFAWLLNAKFSPKRLREQRLQARAQRSPSAQD